MTQTLKTAVHAAHADLVRRAAAKKGQTVSDFISDLIVPWAAAELGEKVPELPRIGRRWQASLIAKAAEAEGLSPKEFADRAVAEAALQRLGYAPASVPPPAPVVAPARESGMRPRARVNGRY